MINIFMPEADNVVNEAENARSGMYIWANRITDS